LGVPEGYSLLELLVVLAILSVVAMVITGYGPSHRQSRDLKLEAYRLEMDLRAARSHAVYSGQPVGFFVDVGQGTWWYAKADSHRVPDGLRLTVYTGRKLIGGGASAGAIEFFPNGQSSGGHITLEARDDSSRVDVDWMTGRIHLRSDDDQ
jgi:general secretion pathway protein H